MENQISDQIRSLNELFIDLEKLGTDSQNQWHEFISNNTEGFEKWKAIVKSAYQGDEESIKIVNQYLSDVDKEQPQINSRTCNKTDFEWYVHTKDKIPLWTVQKLWISHQILSKASDITELASLVADATGNAEAAIVIGAIGLTLYVLRSKDEGCGIYIRWEPGPLLPGTPGGIIVAFKGQ